jgi:2-octaprenyl-6-methoxyphenol hydroxylase
MIATQSDNDFGAPDFLASYAKKRESDQSRTIQFTDALVHVFSNEWLALTAIRNLGLTLLDTLPFAKSILAKHAMGLHL